MTTPRILLLSYLILTVLIGLVLEQVVLGASGWSPFAFLNASVADVQYFWAKLLGFVLAIALGLWAWRSPRTKDPATQVVEEMQRVTWPTFAETRAATWAVVVATLVCAVILGLFDYGWGLVTHQVYSP